MFQTRLIVSAIQELRNTVAKLRAPGGCPWDREQTHQSLADCLMEECAELLEAIDSSDFEHMREELGDVLLQVVMHSQMAEEAKQFDLEKVAADVNEKLIRRHPHVFGDLVLENSDQVLDNWYKIKTQEHKNRPDGGVENALPPARLPALLFARDVFKRLQRRTQDAGNAVDLTKAGKLAKNLDEKRAGQLLFELVAACRLAGIDPESALRRHAKYIIENNINAQP